MLCKQCDAPLFHSGLCEEHYTAKVAARFWPMVDGREDPQQCWLWTGPTKARGYGVAHFGGPVTTNLAHRVAWRLTYGSFPDAQALDHLCSTKRCVNPRHLDPCTSMENIRRSWAAMPVDPTFKPVARSRRDYGTGSITDRGNSRWLLRWYTPPDPISGQRTRRAETFTGTRRAAMARLAAVTAEVHHDGAAITLGAAIDRWRAQAGHAPGTARNYDLAAATIPDPTRAQLIGTIQARTIATVVDHVLAEHGPHRARQVHAVISGALTHAWRQEWIQSNPARRVQPPAQPKRKRSDPTRAEVRRLMLVADTDPQIGAWVRVHAVAGARRQEVIALRWSDVDLERGQLSIMRAIDPITGDEKAVKADGERVVAIGPTTGAALRRWRLAFLERAVAVGAHPVDDPYVFTHALDGAMPWRPDYATKRFAKLRDTAELVDDNGSPLADGVEPRPIRARLHDIRHYVATELLSSGIDPKTTAGRLGHSRVATTTDLYGHVVQATDQAAADLLEDRLGG